MTTPQTIGLFEGYGGLTMAVEEVFGAELIAYSEVDPAASKLLAHHHPDVPNLGDITAVDWDRVQRDTDRQLILTGGFPCQDLSLAGLGAGLRPGTRSGLWSHMAYAIDQLRPDLVIIENVRGLLSADAACELEPCPWCVGDDEGRPLRALGAVLGDLADLGYDAQWIGLRAADVGAPHGRFRVFVTAWPAAHTDSDAVREQPVTEPGRSGAAKSRQSRGDAVADTASAGRAPGRPEGRRRPEPADARNGAPVRGRPEEPGRRDRVAANADGAGPQGGGLRGRAGATTVGDGAPSVADTESSGSQGKGREPAGWSEPAGGSRSVEWGSYEPAIRRWELILERPAPAPTLLGKKGGQQLSPRFVEWLMGLPDGWVTDPAIGLTRNEQLARLGNGVVPQQASAALRYLVGSTAAVEPGLAAAS